MNMLTDAQEYAAQLFAAGFTFSDFALHWPNLAASGYGDEVKTELTRLNKEA